VVKKKRVLIGAGVIAVGVLAGILLLPRSEALVYQGKALGDWSKRAYAGDAGAAAALKSLGREAVPGLTKLLTYHDSLIRKQVWAVQSKLPKGMSRFVRGKVRPPDAVTVREAAARALGNIGPDARAAIPALGKALRDKEGRVCWEAAGALRRIGKEAVPSLCEALGAKHATVRHAAAYELGEMGPQAEAAIPALIQSLSDTNAQVRASAGYSLSRMGTAAVPGLLEARAHGNETARQAAATTLERFYPSLRPALPILMTMAADEAPAIRRQGIEGLTAIRPSTAEIVSAWMIALNDPVTEVRLAAIKGLSRAGRRGQSAIPELTRLTEDKEESIRNAARDALGKIGLAESANSAVPTN
jgi:HEAT repeat protein